MAAAAQPVHPPDGISIQPSLFNLDFETENSRKDALRERLLKVKNGRLIYEPSREKFIIVKSDSNNFFKYPNTYESRYLLRNHLKSNVYPENSEERRLARLRFGDEE